MRLRWRRLDVADWTTHALGRERGFPRFSRNCRRAQRHLLFPHPHPHKKKQGRMLCVFLYRRTRITRRWSALGIFLARRLSRVFHKHIF